MSKKTVILIVTIAVVIGVLWTRHYFSPGEVVKRNFLDLVEAYEAESILGVMSSISRGYSDPWGLSYETIAGYVRESQETYENLQLDHEILGSQVIDEKEEVRLSFQFILWGTLEGTRGYVFGSRSQPCTATFLWLKEQPGWRLASTEELDIPELRDELDHRRRVREERGAKD